MSRRKAAEKRPILPDPLFGSVLLAKFVNIVMRRGKKSIAENIVYNALQELVKLVEKSDEKFLGGGLNSIKTNAALRKAVLEKFEKCLDELRPTVETRSRRVGGANYQVPVEVPRERGIALAMRWLVEFASKRNEKTMSSRLANEIIDILNKRGGAMKKRETVLSMAKANQAFAHFRW